MDVRDAGRLHALALTAPDAGGKRIWSAAGPFGWNQVLAVLRKACPKADLPEDAPNWVPSTDKIDSEYGRELLGGKWIALEETVLETIKTAENREMSR